jgi:hypothetical protein
MDPAQLAANLAAVAPGAGQPTDGIPANLTTAPAAPPPAAQVVAPPVPTVPLEQFNSLRQRLDELEKADKEREAAKRNAEMESLKLKGDYEKLFGLQQTQSRAELEAANKRLQETEERAKRTHLDREIAIALADKDLIAGTAPLLTKLIREDFNVTAVGDTYVAQSKDFRSPGDYIAALLGQPQYQGFLRAKNPNGGTGGATGTQSAPTPLSPAAPAAASQFANLTEWAIQAHKAGAGQQQASPTQMTTMNQDGSYVRHKAPGFGLATPGNNESALARALGQMLAKQK